MWQGNVVSVVLPTYNEKESIARCINDFLSLPFVDEVLVIDNNAAEGTREEVAKTPAHLVVERKQGYGWAWRRGLMEARGDLIALCESDGTFADDDLEKLLVYTKDFDIVYGSRTLGWMIWENANMGWFLRLGNIIVAKLIEVLFNCRSLSDVGCTFRLLNRETSDFLLDFYHVRRFPFRTGDVTQIDSRFVRGRSDTCELPAPSGKVLGNRQQMEGYYSRAADDRNGPHVPHRFLPVHTLLPGAQAAAQETLAGALNISCPASC